MQAEKKAEVSSKVSRGRLATYSFVLLEAVSAPLTAVCRATMLARWGSVLAYVPVNNEVLPSVRSPSVIPEDSRMLLSSKNP